MKTGMNQLEIGQRYWLDSIKDVSGVCIDNTEGNLLFNDIEGKCDYIIDDNGTVKFGMLLNFYVVESI